MCSACHISDGVVGTSAKPVGGWEMEAKNLWEYISWSAGPLKFHLVLLTTLTHSFPCDWHGCIVKTLG